MKQIEFDELVNKLISPIESIYARIETELLKDIAVRFKNYDTMGGLLEWRIQKLQELGALNADIVKEIAELADLPYIEIKKAIQEVVGASVDLDLYQSAFNLGFIDVNPNNILLTRVLQERYNEVEDMVELIHNTMINNTKQEYLHMVDKVYLEAATGSKSHTEAIQDAIVDLGKKGIAGATYKRKNGSTYTMSIEPVVRRNVLSTLMQASNQASHHYIEETGVKEVYVSQHLGARNKGTGPKNHESWQGKVYSITEFVKVTGYGTLLGLAGVNCRHLHYAYFEGLSLPPEERIDSKENGRVYELTQRQRKMERDIRKTKKQLEIFKTVEDELMIKDRQEKLTEKNNEIAKFVEEHPELRREYAREKIQ